MAFSARLSTIVGVAGVLIATAGVAQAQPQGPAGPGQQQPDIASILHLRPDQQSAYAQYKANSQPTPDQVDARRAAYQGLASLPTPARLDRVATALRIAMAMFQRNADATRAFYSQLSPDQKRTFDQVTAPRVGVGVHRAEQKPGLQHRSLCSTGPLNLYRLWSIATRRRACGVTRAVREGVPPGGA